MPRQMRNVRLQTRDARRQLAPQKEPYWKDLRRGRRVAEIPDSDPALCCLRSRGVRATSRRSLHASGAAMKGWKVDPARSVVSRTICKPQRRFG